MVTFCTHNHDIRKHASFHLTAMAQLKGTFLLLRQDAVKSCIKYNRIIPTLKELSKYCTCIINQCVLWKPVPTVERSRVICSIQHYSLLFTTPLTIWQGLYSSLFYAKGKKKRGKAWPGCDFYARTVMGLSWQAYAG